jgi:transposase
LIGKLADRPRLQRFVQYHREIWACAHVQVEALEAEMTELAQHRKVDLENMMTAPGVGPIVATTALAVIYDASRFPSAKHAASYTGVVPGVDQSGDRNHTGHIVRRGSGELRSMLCEAAQHARRPDNPLNPYFTAICARRGYRMAIVAVAHRLCRILYAMLRDGKPFSLEKAGVEAGKFEKVSVRRYRKVVAGA